MPDASTPNEPAFIPHVTEDEFLYDDRAPWPSDANGTGNSLQRRAPVFYGNQGRVWIAARPTPGTVIFGGNVTVKSDGALAWTIVVPRTNLLPRTRPAERHSDQVAIEAGDPINNADDFERGNTEEDGQA